MNYTKLLAIASLFTMSQSAVALKSDAEQPVYIDSDTASYSDQLGISTYIGNVVTVQGSLHIESDKLVVYIHEGDITKMVFTGQPATFRQLPSEGKEEIYGEGLTGEFYPNQDRLVLIEKAVVKQGGNTSASRLIVYDIKKSLIKAGDKSSDNKQVRTVFQPKAK